MYFFLFSVIYISLIGNSAVEVTHAQLMIDKQTTFLIVLNK